MSASQSAVGDRRPVAVDDQIARDLLARCETQPRDVWDTVDHRTARREPGDRFAAPHRHTGMPIGRRRHCPLERAAPSGQEVEPIVVVRRVGARLHREHVPDEVETESAVVGQQLVRARNLSLQDRSAASEEQVGQPELGDAATLPVGERTRRVERRWFRIPFEHGHVVPIVREHHGRSQPAHSSACDHDVPHAMKLLARAQRRIRLQTIVPT